ncbi:MAG: histidine--tRNA ligase [Clostridiales bacterium]|nr:histidine--tRNA ligase [Clostridiales bacterium]
MINVPKGTKDCLPEESYKWQFVEEKIRKITRNFGVKEIRTPTFEHTEVFTHGVGDTTDIVNKEMYTFLDKGNRSITLKPEGTASIARSFIENGMKNYAMPVKMYYITPCFRYERPQAGRLREFHQFGVEVYGSKEASIDAECIILAKNFLDELGVKVKLLINSIGCKECRKAFNDALKNYLESQLEGMCPTCKDRFSRNPLRILDCKESGCKEIIKNAPSILDYLCKDCSTHFEALKEYLSLAKVEYEIDDKIVRGLDYYTKTVFEFVSDSIGAQGTVCGGGRYDGLIADLGGNDISGVGFAMGIERLLLVMENIGVEIERTDKVKFYLLGIGEEESKKAFELAINLRANGVSTEIDHMNRSVKAQFKYADKINAEFVGVIGSDELANGVVSVKEMATGKEQKVKIENLLEYLL